MNSAPFPEGSVNDPRWSLEEIVELQPDRQAGPLQWWYNFTTPTHTSTNTSYVRREADRKAHMLSTVALFLLATLIFFIPATLQMPLSTFYINLIAIAVTSGLLLLNKKGKTLLAGRILVATFEISLALSIVLIRPLNETDLPLYDLFVIGEILALSLLPMRIAFVVAVLNALFTCIDLIYHPYTLGLAQHMAFLPVLARPVGLQFIIAGVAFIWISNATKAIARADRAEMVATLEHAMAEQRAASEQEKQELEESIQQLVRAHVDALNNQVSGRIPYPPAKILWPLVGVINSLWVRLQRAQQAERELQQLKQAISAYNDFFRKSGTSSQQSLSGLRTGTDLDQLITSLRSLYGNTRL